MLVGVFSSQVVGGVSERHIGALAAGDGAHGVEVAVFHLVGHAVVVAVAEAVFQRKLAFAHMVAALQVGVDKACGQRRVPVCHDAASILTLFQYDVDDARGAAVQVTDAWIVAVFHTLDLLGLEVGQSRHGHLLPVDLQDGQASVHGDALQRHIHLQAWQPQHVE